MNAFLNCRTLRRVACLTAFAFFDPCYALATEPEAPPKSTSMPVSLVGGVAVFQPHSLVGKWDGHIRRFGRHPKLYIDRCQDGQISGTYKGILGKFPVSGFYEEATGDITINVDITSAALFKLKKFRTKNGLIRANIVGDRLVGTASITELGSRAVRWEAEKDPSYLANVGDAPVLPDQTK